MRRNLWGNADSVDNDRNRLLAILDRPPIRTPARIAVPKRKVARLEESFLPRDPIGNKLRLQGRN